jgi:hypothetical protein
MATWFRPAGFRSSNLFTGMLVHLLYPENLPLFWNLCWTLIIFHYYHNVK